MSNLYVETDYDFSIKYNGKVYASHSFHIEISPSDFDKLEILGPWGTSFDERVKCWEFEQGIKSILKNPTEYFSNLGGNRGVEFYP